MQMAVSESTQAAAHTESRGFLADITARHASVRRHVVEHDPHAGRRGDRQVLVNLLNEALASEIACMLRYRRHFYLVRGTADAALMGELLDRANEEQRHADLIAERIVQLGGQPDLSPLGHCDRRADYGDGASAAQMVQEELAAERLAIQGYEEILRFVGRSDGVTRRLIEDILAEEQVHASELSRQLGTLPR